ncbi:MAG: DUF4159 domain-containing protein [Alphaproteobacteria bacterium]|nr:DUF4159 domain-containing protein [Alphaproteobacteria bacterium]
MTWRRRDVLGGLGALALWPGVGRALGDATHVDVAELDLGPGTTSRPQAWKRLLYHVETSTSVEVLQRSVVVTPDGAELFEHPFCVLLGTGGFDAVSDKGIEQLSQFLDYGGFLFIDDTTGDDASGCDAAVRRLCSRLFPTRPLAPLPADHSVLRAFFLLDRCPGRLDRHPFLEGVTVGNLCPVVYCRNDVSGALDRTEQGMDRHPCVPGGETQRREAVKVGINLLMYALTANYKNDQAHVRQLMLDRRLK